MPWIELRDVWVSYGDVEVFRGESLSIDGPGMVLVLGPNGAGKTTLLKLIAGFVKPRRGQVVVMGIDVTGNPRKASRFVAYVPQMHPSPPPYPITPLEYVECVLRAMGVENVEELALKSLEMVGLDRSLWRKDLRKLSGGEKQRVFLAPVLILDRKIVLLDEPLTSVDPRWKEDIAKIIASRARTSLTLITCHDPTLLLPYANHILLLYRRIVAFGTPRDVLRLELLREVYGSSAIAVEKHLHLADQHYW